MADLDDDALQPDLPTALEGLPETAELEDIYHKYIDGPQNSAAATKLAHDLAHFGPRCTDFWSEMVGPDIAENSRDFFGLMTPERMDFLDPERTVDTDSLTRMSDLFKPAEPRAAQPPATAGTVEKRKGGAKRRPKGKKNKASDDTDGFGPPMVPVPNNQERVYDFEGGADLHNAKVTIVLGGVGPTAKGARSLTPTRLVLEWPVLSDEDMELEDGDDVERGFDEASLPRLRRKISKAIVTKALQVAHDTGDEYKDLTKRGLNRWVLDDDVQAKISFVSPANPRKTQCTSWPLTPLTDDTLCAAPSQPDPA